MTRLWDLYEKEVGREKQISCFLLFLPLELQSITKPHLSCLQLCLKSVHSSLPALLRPSRLALTMILHQPFLPLLCFYSLSFRPLPRNLGHHLWEQSWACSPFD